MSGSADRFRSLLSRHWLKVGIAVILVIVIIKKDFSFQINLRSPVKLEEPAQAPPPTQPVKEEKEQERLTENRPVSADGKGQLPPVDRFEFPSIGGEKPARKSAVGELAKIDPATRQAFLERFTHVAEAEQRKYGIPASVILGNGLLLSLAGQRDMALRGNNYFALPCTADWQGETGRYQGSCYRHYENAWTSFRDHSLYLTTGSYSQLRQLASKDYRLWAEALGKMGFGEQKNYDKQLIGLIEELKLHELDALR